MAITWCLWLMSAMFIAAASEYIVGDEKVSWLEAETWCLEQGYHLASIHSAEENAAVSAACPDGKCWAGLQCIDGDQFEWRWSDGTDFDYDNWYTNEPNNFGNPANEDCMEIFWANAGAEYNGFWNNHQCSELRYPICRVVEYIVGDEALTWLEAETWCVEQGHHLASIHSAEENAAVLSLCPGEPGISNCWTGLNCIDGDNFEWTWSDGTDFDYPNWYPGEPNNEMKPTNEDCVELYLSGPWNNKECKYLNYPICRVQNDPVRVCEASICAMADDILTVSVSRDDAEFEQLSSDSSWHQVTELTVTNITASTVLRFEVDNVGGPGGFVATVKLQCSDGSESTFITDDGNTYFDVVYSLDGNYDVADFVQFGSGPWSSKANEGNVQCMDPDAYWMWNGGTTDDVTFDLEPYSLSTDASIAVSGGATVDAHDVGGADETNPDGMETVYGVVTAVVVISAAVLLAVFMVKRRKSTGKKAETEMCSAVHVPELSPTDCVEMDTVEVATGKESGDGVEAATE